MTIRRRDSCYPPDTAGIDTQLSLACAAKRHYFTSNMRWSDSSRPAGRFGIDSNDIHRRAGRQVLQRQQRWARSMRYIVAHMQTTGERK